MPNKQDMIYDIFSKVLRHKLQIIKLSIVLQGIFMLLIPTLFNKWFNSTSKVPSKWRSTTIMTKDN